MWIKLSNLSLSDMYLFLLDSTMMSESAIYVSFFFKILFIFRQRGREGEREGEKHQCVVATHAPPNWGPGLKPKHVP